MQDLDDINQCIVSTHSRLKAAVGDFYLRSLLPVFQHTAA